jgi:aspartyl protease family protein
MDARHPQILIGFYLAAVVFLGLAVGAAAQDSAQGLRAQLRDLATRDGISATGLEKIGPAVASRPNSAGGPPEQRLPALLAGFNYMIFRDSAGRVSGFRVLGKARGGPPKVTESSVPAKRRGAHYLVDAVLIGPTGLWLNRQMVVDTGASTVVLPISAISSLGMRDADLVLGTVETAGGKVQARMGRLSAVRVGHAEVKDIPVTFIADEQLGRTALLGMSFLDQFRVTFDDFGQRIILNAK